MKVSKKFKAAITVAAITGVMTVSGAAMAGTTSGWNTGSLSGAATSDLNVMSQANTEIVSLGDSGRAIEMTNAAAIATAPAWTAGITPVDAKFTGVHQYAAGKYYAVTEGGDFLTSIDGGKNWSAVATNPFAGEKIVAMAGNAAASLVLVTPTQWAVSTDGAKTFTVKNLTADGASGTDLGVKNAVNGIVYSGSANNYYVFGSSAKLANINIVSFAGADIADLDKVTDNRPVATRTSATFGATSVNAMAMDANGDWYIAGNGGKLALVSISPATSKIATNTPAGYFVNRGLIMDMGTFVGNINGLSIDTATNPQTGYFVADSGAIYKFNGLRWTQETTVVSENLNAVVQRTDATTGAKRVFAVGDAGKSIWSSSLAWTLGTGVTDGTAANTIATPLGINNISGTYYVAGVDASGGANDNVIYSTSDFKTYTPLTGNGALTANTFTGVSLAANDKVFFGLKPAIDGTPAPTVTMLVTNGAAHSIATSAGLADGDGQVGAVTDVIDLLAYVPTAGVVLAASSVADGGTATGKQFLSQNVSTLAAPALAGLGTQAQVGQYTTDICSIASHVVRVEDNNTVWTCLATTPGLSVAARQAVLSGDLTGVTSGTNLMWAPDSGASSDFILSDATKKILYRTTITVGTGATDKAVTAKITMPQNIGAIAKIFGATTNDFYVTDAANVMYHYLNGAWSIVRTATVTGQGTAFGSQVATVTGGAANPTYSTGGVWAETGVDAPANTSLTDVDNATAKSFVLTGQNGMVFNSSDGKNWTRLDVTASGVGSHDLNAVDTFGYDHIYAIGTSKVIKLQDGTWSDVPVPASYAANVLSDVVLTGTNAGYVVGNGGLVLDIANSLAKVDISAAPLANAQDLTTIYANSESDVYVGGANGVLARYDGAAWSDLTAGPFNNNSISSIYGTVNNLYASAGTIVAKWDGEKWTDLKLSTTAAVVKLWGYGDVLYASAGSDVYKYSGGEWTKELTGSTDTLKAITGSQAGKMLLAVGDNLTVKYRDLGFSTVVAFGNQTGVNVTKTTNTDKTAAELQTEYKLPEGLTPIASTFSFEANVATAEATGIFGFTYTPTNSTTTVGDLQLYKLLNGESKKLITNYTEEREEGKFWITTQDDQTKPLSSDTTLTADKTYSVWFAIKDQGEYDLNNVATQITDPIVPVMAIAGGSSSSSSGCVFNPTAGFGLEWLMLMAAPMIAVIRNRFKK